MKEKILAILKERNDFISGQELCDSFNVSRTAIWKAIQSLKKDGYEIESVTNKGYRILSCPEMISEEEIEKYLTTDYIGRTISYHEVIDSTNLECRRIASAGDFETGCLVIADRQDSGRGRRGRSWVCPAGVNIAMSILLRPTISPDKASMLTILAAMAVSKGIEALTELKAYIKWPNDIVVNNKKICGILTEMSVEMDYIDYVIVGIGINVNQIGFDKEIENIASSIKAESGAELSRSRLIAEIMNEFERLLAIFEKDGNLESLKESYNSHLISLNKDVKILDPKGEYEAVSLGIDEMGELLVKTKEGQIDKIYAGEVSVRGLYGYV